MRACAAFLFLLLLGPVQAQESIRVAVASSFMDTAASLGTAVEEIHRVDEARALVRLGLGNQDLLSQVTNRSVGGFGLREGDRVFAQVKSVTARR